MSDFERRIPRYEDPGAVDYPGDVDRPTANPVPEDDASCAIPWVVRGYQAIEVYVDPALRDRTHALCELVETWAATHRDLDTLTDAATAYGDEEELSVSVYDQLPDAPATGVVAVAFTLG